MSGTTDYPDLEPDPLGDLKSIKRLPSMRANAPKISWGGEYRAWPVERRLHYAERLASTMNHAADVLQTERNAMIEVANSQEVKLKHAAKVYAALGETMHTELANADAEKQKLYTQIVSLQRDIKEARRRAKQREAACGNHD